jgi:hypothetical protein
LNRFQTGRPLVLASGKIINRRGQITGGIPPYRETQDYVRSAIALFTSDMKRLKQTARSTEKNNASPLFSSRNFRPKSANRSTRSSLSASERESFLFIEVQ